MLADPPLLGLRGEEAEKKEATGRRRPLLSYSFEKLKMSSDDGIRMLLLDFGGEEGEIVSIVCFISPTNESNALTCTLSFESKYGHQNDL